MGCTIRFPLRPTNTDTTITNAAWVDYVKARTPQPMDVFDPLDTFMDIPIERNSACPVGQLFLINKNQDHD